MRPAPLLLAAALLAACAEPPVLHNPADATRLDAPPPPPPPPPPAELAKQHDGARPPPPPPDDQQVAASDNNAPPPAQVATNGTPCATDPRIVACARARIDSAPPIWLDLATTNAQIAVAWVTGRSASGQKNYVAYLARFSPNLAPAGQVELHTSGDATGVAITPLPQGGWILAVTTAQGVEIHPLRADGQAGGAVVSIQDAGNTSVHAPHLVGRPDGAPLLVWSSWFQGGHVTSAALLDDAGRVRTRVPLFTNVEEPHLTNAVFAGDAFLVAGRVRNAGIIARVALDGRVSTVTPTIGRLTEYHQLAWTGSSTRMTFCDFSKDPIIGWASVDRGGNVLAGPITIGKSPVHYDPSPLLAIGEDSLVLLGGYTGGTGTASHLEFTRLDRSGQTIVKPWSLLGGQHGNATDYRMLPLGNKVAVAWLEGAMQPGSPAKGLNIAVVSP